MPILAGIQRRAGDEQVAIGQLTDPLDPLGEQPVDLHLLPLLQPVRPTRACPAAPVGPARAARVASSNRTSRTQTLTLLLETPSSATISPIVHACARSSRARSLSASLPRYPTTG